MNQDAGHFSITYQDMTDIAANIRALLVRLERNLSESKSLIVANIGNDSVWNSNAAMSFRGKYDTLSRLFPEFKDAMLKCANFLDGTVLEEYKSLEAKVQSAAEQALTTDYSGQA